MASAVLDRLRQQVERDTTAKMVVHALNSGATVTRLAQAMEFSRQTIYTLRDEGRVLMGITQEHNA